MILYLHKTEIGRLYISKYKDFNPNFGYVTWVICVTKENFAKEIWEDLKYKDWVFYK